MTLFIGLMSGTSLDGVDGVLVDFADEQPAVLAHIHRPFPDGLRAELLSLNQPGDNELHRAALAGNDISRAYADCVEALLAAAGRSASAVVAMGAHGQTVRHRPQAFDGTGYTVQLINGALLAEQSGIDVICDFRSRDLAAGGQGAPLVPAFHASQFGRPGQALAVLNVGGIANLTLIGADGADVLGFDCGPGNALMDAWCERHLGQRFDDGGRWASGGTVHAELLTRLCREPFFDLAPPKSTGRDLFHLSWLEDCLGDWDQTDAVANAPRALPTPQDIQATLCELTAVTAAEALSRHGGRTDRLLVCGGGAFNGHLMARLAARLPGVQVDSTAGHGVPPDQVEALAFAWMARAFVRRETASLPAVTGARGSRLLGALYPAGL
jgi:anhydro-N-acetylmuramic acid kinase